MDELVSEGLRLDAHFARPAGLTRVPGLLILPGFPRGPGGAATVGSTYASLIDRVADVAGWAGLTITMRGTGASEGDFSIEGWLADVRAGIDALATRSDVTGIWLAGFRLGGTLAIVTAAHDERVRGLATFAAPASLRRLGTRPGLVPGVRAAYRCAAHQRVSRRSHAVDPCDRKPRRSRGREAHRAAPMAARARHRRRRRLGRRCPLAGRRGRRLRRTPARAQRRPPFAARSPRNRGAPRLARPPRPLSNASRSRVVEHPPLPSGVGPGFVEDGFERCFEGECRLPFRCRPQPARVADEAGYVDRPDEIRILHQAQPNAARARATRPRSLRRSGPRPNTRCRPRPVRLRARRGDTRARCRARR